MKSYPYWDWVWQWDMEACISDTWTNEMRWDIEE